MKIKYLAIIALSALCMIKIASAGTTPNTTDHSPQNPPPSLNNTVTKSCPPGTALIGVTVERVEGKEAVLRPRCRPAPTGSSNAWCDPAPPSNVDCNCDGYEHLTWQRNGTGCWMCVGDGKACGKPAACACEPGANGSGAWVPVNCTAGGNILEADLRGKSANTDTCYYATDTACTYQAYPGYSCP